MSEPFDRKNVPIIEVIWSDCQLFVGGWEAHAEVMSRRGGVLQRTIGYVLADDKKGIVLTGSLSQGGNVFGTVNIPAGQIVKRRRIRP
jgi:hypothetical protein